MTAGRMLVPIWVPALWGRLGRAALLIVAVSGWLGAARAQTGTAPDHAASGGALVQQGEYLARAGDCIACHTQPGGKLFAGFYALYAGLLFIIGFGVVLAPVVHRMMHKFHWYQKN